MIRKAKLPNIKNQNKKKQTSKDFSLGHGDLKKGWHTSLKSRTSPWARMRLTLRNTVSVEDLTLAASPCPLDEPDCSRIQTVMGNPTVLSTNIHLQDVATALVLVFETSYLGGLP